jgi:hypothetical protein
MPLDPSSFCFSASTAHAVEDTVEDTMVCFISAPRNTGEACFGSATLATYPLGLVPVTRG